MRSKMGHGGFIFQKATPLGIRPEVFLYVLPYPEQQTKKDRIPTKWVRSFDTA